MGVLQLDPSLNQNLFLERLGSVQGWMRQQGVDYRIVGSIATSAYVGPDLAPLDFNRVGYKSFSEQVPDIDLIVPRRLLPLVREYRRDLLRQDVSVRLGLAFPSKSIDFLPDNSESGLTHRDLLQPIDTSLLDPVEVDLLGVPVRTVSPRALLHTYVVCGGLVRPKDLPKIRLLAKYANQYDSTSEAAFRPFHDFIGRRNDMYPGFIKARKAQLKITSGLSPRVNSCLYKLALPMASFIGRA